MCSAFNVQCHIYSSFPRRQYYCFKIISIPRELNNIEFGIVLCCGAWDGAVVRVLASHQCGLGSNPGVDATCGLSLLLVLSFAPRGFSLGTLVFLSIPVDQGSGRRRTTLWMCYLQIIIYLFIIYKRT